MAVAAQRSASAARRGNEMKGRMRNHGRHQENVHLTEGVPPSPLQAVVSPLDDFPFRHKHLLEIVPGSFQTNGTEQQSFGFQKELFLIM